MVNNGWMDGLSMVIECEVHQILSRLPARACIEVDLESLPGPQLELESTMLQLYLWNFPQPLRNTAESRIRYRRKSDREIGCKVKGGHSNKKGSLWIWLSFCEKQATIKEVIWKTSKRGKRNKEPEIIIGKRQENYRQGSAVVGTPLSYSRRPMLVIPALLHISQGQ